MVGLALVVLGGGLGAGGQTVPAANRLWPNLVDNIERPLRYRPEGSDFVIENGGELFNRPLYGGNTAFRVDAGDRPEFVLYLPGRGGNLRLGVRTAAGAKWLHASAQVEARYRPGAMLHTVRDPLLDEGTLQVTTLALAETEGLILRLEATGVPDGVELVWAYGGANGQRGRRDGDIGTENIPIGDWFQLRPEYCRGNEFTITGRTFTLRAALPREQRATILGVMPAGAALATGTADKWNDCAALLDDQAGVSSPAKAGGPVAEEDRPRVLTGRVGLRNAEPLYLSFQRLDETRSEDLATYREVTAGPAAVAPVAPLRPAYAAAELPAVFARTEAHFAALRRQITVETPDPFINAAVGALNVAADAVWDEPQGAVMHGAIAWRTKLLGWRGPYAMDALGWTERARRHLAYWATRQNVTPIPERLPPADADANLARSEAALHSNGDLSNSHYDMNLVYIDAVFRHLLWTGDREFAREVWPVIERHLAWERRLFRREFAVGDERLPLYEAYAAIWASDDLQYHGGGTAHASAYNYWHLRMAARLAGLLERDGSSYEREADLIARGLRELLWTGRHFAEYKDLLGRQLVHPSAGLWTFYHVLDAGLVTPDEAARMAASLEADQPRLPVRGPGVPDDQPYAVLATTNWLPYSWSINNVTMNENLHTALGLWQAGRPEEAFRLTKSALLASMFMGICPGNVGSMNYLDVYRRESQRDFADGSGVTSRALVEGLFGLRPDALAGELVVAPGFLGDWNRARLGHPLATVGFVRQGWTDTYEIAADGRFQNFRLLLKPRTPTCRVTVAGAEGGTQLIPATAGPVVTITGGLETSRRVIVEWIEERPIGGVASAPAVGPVEAVAAPASAVGTGPAGSLEAVGLTAHFNERVTEIFRPGKYVAPRSPYVSLALPAQGIGAWAGHVNATAEIDDTGLRAASAAGIGQIALPGGVTFATPGPGAAPNVLFVSQWDNYPPEATVSLTGRARRVHLLMAGSTNHMQSRIDNGEVVVGYADGTNARLALRNPETWWPIEQDYFIDDFQFRVAGALPTRVDLKTGRVRVLDAATFKGTGRVVPGGAATVLALALDPGKELRSLTVRALANEVVIGLMAATLER